MFVMCRNNYRQTLSRHFLN